MSGRGPASMLGRFRPAPVLPDALCRDGDPEDWFADDPLLAVSVCHACPELLPCRDWALEEPNLRGVWGGLTQAQRRIARRMGGQR